MIFESIEGVEITQEVDGIQHDLIKVRITDDAIPDSVNIFKRSRMKKGETTNFFIIQIEDGIRFTFTNKVVAIKHFKLFCGNLYKGKTVAEIMPEVYVV